jgi:signal transduction histidine kinase
MRHSLDFVAPVFNASRRAVTTMSHRSHTGHAVDAQTLDPSPFFIPAFAPESALFAAQTDLLRHTFTSITEVARAIGQHAALIFDTEDVLICLRRPGTNTLIEAFSSGALHGLLPESGVFVSTDPSAWAISEPLQSLFPALPTMLLNLLHIDQRSAGLLIIQHRDHQPGITARTNTVDTALDTLATIGSAALTQAYLREQLALIDLRHAQHNEHTNELKMLLSVTNNLSAAFNIDDLLKVFVSELHNVVPFDSAAIFILDRHKSMRVMLYDGPPSTLVRIGANWALTHHFAQVVDARKPVIIPDTRAHTADALVWHDQIRTQLNGHSSNHIVTWLGVPIMAHDEVVGILTLDRSIPNGYTESHIALALAVAQQAGLAIDNARLHAQKLEAVVLAERNRLSRDLHDSVSQAIYSMTLGVRTMESLAGIDVSRVLEPLPHVVNMAEAALSEMRTLIYELRPELLETEGLLAALKKQIIAMETRHSLMVHAMLLPSEPELSIDTKEMIYRIAVEALHNIIKHARASTVWITLSHSDTAFMLNIRDNGVGFHIDAVPTQHFGLRLMRERIAQIGGKIIISSAPQAGTQIVIDVPPHATPLRR